MDETSPPRRALRVLFVASEVFPLAKTGGLADVCGALPPTLARLGVDVRVMLPGYPQALDLAEDKRSLALDVPEGRLIAARMPNTGIPVLLYDCPSLFARRGGLYQDPDGSDWPDNDRRFGLFCRAAAAVALGQSGLRWRPHLVHANDWHTGLVPAFLRCAGDGVVRSVFTIHNLAFQGNFPFASFAGLGLPQEILSPDGIEFYGQLSFLKAGLRYGDRLTTVSPTYAREILTDEHGCGFQGLLRMRARHLVGILNGVDYSIWDPANDAALPARYSAEAPAGKAACKAALRSEVGLEEVGDAPLIIYVNRLTHQKMADVVLEATPRLVANGGQVVVHGEGERSLEEGFSDLARAYPRQVAVRLGYTEPLAHRLHAGADLSLTPSRFEPCGLTTMYAMRYGAVPVTRPVGGLRDTVEDAADAGVPEGSGFVFGEANAEALARCVGRASTWYGRSGEWEALRRRAMERDFGWERSARRYIEIYEKLLGEDVPFRARRSRVHTAPRMTALHV